MALRALRQAGLEVTADIAQTAEQFTELVRKNSYDVVLADYKLPGWNGIGRYPPPGRTRRARHSGLGSTGRADGGRLHQAGRL